jgi:hypothetical protein
MEESTQQIIALLLVAVIAGFELRRRYLKKKRGKIGCDGCGPDKAKPGKEAPVKFYKRR